MDLDIVFVDHLLKTKKERQNYKKHDIQCIFIYQNEGDKACFQYDMTYGFTQKIFLKEHVLIKYYVIKILILLEIRNMMDIKGVLLQQFINLLIKTLRWWQKNDTNNRNQLLENLIDNIWGTDLADIELIRKFNKGFRFLLCAVNIYSKYAWVVPLKNKKGISITQLFKTFQMTLIANQKNMAGLKQ